MTMHISFHTAKMDDVPFLLRLRKLTMDAYLKAANIDTSEHYHLSRIEEHFHDSIIIVVEKQAIGLLKLGNLAQSLHVRQFQILPEFQNRGIGKQVLALVKHKAAKMGKCVTLNVLKQNPALALYKREAFGIVGESAIEYQMRWQSEKVKA